MIFSENFADLIEPGLRKIFTEQYNLIEEMGQMFFNMNTTGLPYEKDSSVGAFGDMQPFQGTVQYDEVYQGYDVRYEFAEMTLGFKVERKLHDDDMYGVINRKPAGLAVSAKRTKEKYRASVFNDAFSGAGTITLAGITVLNNTEALSLASGSHTTTASSTTQSNSGTSALSPTSVEATRILGPTILDDRDNIIGINYDTLVVPRALEETAWVIINSKGVVNSAENNRNFHFGKYKLAVWDFLTDSNNWFFLDSLLAQQFLMWYTRIPLEFKQDTSFDTLIAKFMAYERYGWGWSDWRWLYGHNVG